MIPSDRLSHPNRGFASLVLFQVAMLRESQWNHRQEEPYVFLRRRRIAWFLSLVWGTGHGAEGFVFSSDALSLAFFCFHRSARDGSCRARPARWELRQFLQWAALPPSSIAGTVEPAEPASPASVSEQSAAAVESSASATAVEQSVFSMEPAAPKQRLATKQSKPATGERLAADQRMAAREQPERSERIRPELEHQWLQRTVGYWMDAQPALEQQSKRRFSELATRQS